MSVKIRAKNDSGNLQTIICNDSGILKTADDDVLTSLSTINDNVILNRTLNFNPNTPSTWTNSRLGIILTQQVDGTQITKNKISRTQANLLNAETLTSLQLWGTAIDCLEYSSIRVMGIATDGFNIYGSIDDVNYYKIWTVFPDTNPNHLNQFNYMFTNPPRYIKIMNGSSTITITLDYSLMN
tara:strand:+ start:319 stop:867 length:549 start_codon:yes stop_codon:yes gene_type:complete